MSNSKVDKFLAETESPPRTKIELWEAEIFELLAKNSTYQKIAAFLKIEGVETNRSNIAKFVKAKKRSELYEKAMQQRGKPIQAKHSQDKPAPKETPLKEPTTESTEPSKNPSQKAPLPNALPEFVWDVKNKPKSRW